MDFLTLIDWLQENYDFSYVEHEGNNRIRFDYGREQSFWLNDDMTVEGEFPRVLKGMLLETNTNITIL
jgi:hypothetical protein